MYLHSGALILTLFVTLLQQTTTVQARCDNPSLRKEWRELSDDEKRQYHTAVHCLMNKPKERYPDEDLVVTRLDDLTWSHTKLADVIHNVANFLPWHRMLVKLHEDSLRNECKYQGPIPYWDWTKDADADTVPTSPVWDPEYGFGGNGVSSGSSESGFQTCVMDGPYAKMNLTIGSPIDTNLENTPHCLIREWNNGNRDLNGNWVVGDMVRRSYNSATMKQIYDRTNYFDFEWSLENGPHAYIHNRVGGDMRPHSAPNDPIFYLHHANIDRIWAKWQGDNDTRLNDFSGWNDRRRIQPASIDDTMPLLGLLDHNVTVRDYMDTRGDNLCYVYTDAS
ncbi:monooxygenase [Marasmius fiardii PR-910]|nr:monooxygenase [Marasmius fiardii PR-910]